MKQRILVDTDVLIDAGRSVEVAVNCLEDAAQASALAISIITQMELIVGCRNQSELRIVERFLLRYEVIKLNEAISERAVNLIRTYRLSHGLLIPDAFIAATALVMNVPLLSKNQRDYRFIESINLLPYIL
jgi:predicted nucleic acid-binding protein